MKIIKRILIGVAILIAVPLLVALFLKREYIIERDIIINKPRQQVFNYLKFLKNQDNFNKWIQVDPALNKEFRGNDGTEGFVYAWKSSMPEVGKGEQEIRKITEGERVDVEVRFFEPFENIAQTPFITEEISPGSTRVKWMMQGKNPYPLNIMNLFMGATLGDDLETSLANLKTVLEQSK